MEVAGYPQYIKRKVKKPCPQCHGAILPNQTVIKTVRKKGKFWFYTYWHYECWKKNRREMYVRLGQSLEEHISEYDGWFESNKFQPETRKNALRLKLPPETIKKRNALMSLYRYHRKNKNLAKMAVINTEIDLLCGSSPYDSSWGVLTNQVASSIMSRVGSLTEYDATQVKGGCRLGDEPSAQANPVRANDSAVQP